MIIQGISAKSVWNAFFDEAGSESFMQSWEWGELQKVEGYEINRVGIYDSKNVVGIAQIIKIRSKRGDFLFVPHGPVLKISNLKSQISNQIKELTNYLIKIAKEEKFSFIRIAPALNDVSETRKILSDVGFKTAPTYMSAESLWVLPLEKSEDELLSNMRKTARYLIRKAQRDGVIIEKRTDEKAVDDFYSLYEKTVERENFVPFSKEMILAEFQAFYKTGNAIFLQAKLESAKNANLNYISEEMGVEKNGPPQRAAKHSPLVERALGGMNSKQDPSSQEYLASALIIFTKSTAFYHQGASIHSKVPAPYLLQWEAIKEAKKRGCRLYNFWGVFRPGRTPKAWQGLTLFKQGFGGQQIDYVLPQDYIISKKYYLTYLYEKLLNWKRGV